MQNKQNIFCDCCGEEMKNKMNFTFEIDLACEVCQNDLSLAIANMINSIRKSNGNLFLTRVKEKINVE